MNLQQFLEHWKLADNPFVGEEARHDAVFARLASRSRGGAGPPPAMHSDFDKILGDLARPATSIVFGEKGSGKTAIRLQIEDRVAAFNAAHPGAGVLLVLYDDLNATLNSFLSRVRAKDEHEGLKLFGLADHADAILSMAVTRLTSALLAPRVAARGDGADSFPRAARRLPRGSRQDWLLLQALYDSADDGAERTGRLRRALRVPRPAKLVLWRGFALTGWLIPAASVMLWAVLGRWSWDTAWLAGVAAAAAVYGLILLKALAWDGWVLRRMAGRVARQVRVLPRGAASWARSLRSVDLGRAGASALPIVDSDEPRYGLLARMHGVAAGLGYASIVVVIDRVDEPTAVSGDPRRMQSLIWPLLNNKFLQLPGFAIKMLLPIELRHALFRESSAFFQEARLDKQNLVERLSWTGAMLYDLCEARVASCASPGAAPVPLLDLFGEDVSRQDLVDALDQMRQPRDAFKFLYRCLGEHCSNVTADQGHWRVPRAVLDLVRKQESERVQELSRGIRPG